MSDDASLLEQPRGIAPSRHLRDEFRLIIVIILRSRSDAAQASKQALLRRAY